MIVLMFGEQWDSLAEPSTTSATVLWSLPNVSPLLHLAAWFTTLRPFPQP